MALIWYIQLGLIASNRVGCARIEVHQKVRDIRNDLRERLAFLDGKHGDALASYMEARERLDADHRETIEAIESERAALKQLLSIEERRALALPPLSGAAEPSIPLVDLLIAKVETCGPVDKEDLRTVAEEAGYEGGRTLHTTLMNITKAGRLRQMSDGRYVTPSFQYDFSQLPDSLELGVQDKN